MPLGEEVPLEQGHQRGAPPKKVVILLLFARIPSRHVLSFGCIGIRFHSCCYFMVSASTLI